MDWINGGCACLSMYDVQGQFPFAYAERPTIDVRVGGESYPMLLDSGTTMCIFLEPCVRSMNSITVTSTPRFPASLEGRPLIEESGQHLDYGVVRGMQLGGGISFEELPCRIYAGGDYRGFDFCGSLALTVFEGFIVEVDPAAFTIFIHDPGIWQPPDNVIWVPVSLEGKGIYIPVEIGGEQYRFKLDTGFTGSIEVSPKLMDSHPANFRVRHQAEISTAFTYHGLRELVPVEIVGLELCNTGIGECVLMDSPNLKLLPQMGTVAALNDGIPGEDRIKGRIGSGFLADFHYWLDLSSLRLYLQHP